MEIYTSFDDRPVQFGRGRIDYVARFHRSDQRSVMADSCRWPDRRLHRSQPI